MQDVAKFLGLPVVNNAMGRWVKVSNQGLHDEEHRLSAPIQQQRAAVRLVVREVVRKVLAAEPLTDKERAVMRDPYAVDYFARTLRDVAKARVSPLVRELGNAPNKQVKAAILSNEIRRANEP